MDRPYFIKSKGRDAGTFIRVGATTIPAGERKILDLQMEGRHVSWDELACRGFAVSDERVRKLCDAITLRRKKAGLPARQIDVTQLINWKLLQREGDALFAGNAFALMTSDFFQFGKIQCALFKGTDRVDFLDKREYAGPLYEQIEEAVNFVLRNIRLGVTIGKVLREERYELPVNAIRELIVNAVCHRNYQDESFIQVAIFDDRLEVTSPGGLYNGLTYEDMLSGHSKIRNRAIANVFMQMGLIENWGTGIRRIFKLAGQYHLPTPQITVSDNYFRIELFRRPLVTEFDSKSGNSRIDTDGCPEDCTGGTEQNVGGRVGGSGQNVGGCVGGPPKNVGGSAKVAATQKSRAQKPLSNSQNLECSQSPNNPVNLKQLCDSLLDLIQKQPSMSAAELADKLSLSSRTVERRLSALKNEGILVRRGNVRSGYWEVSRP